MIGSVVRLLALVALAASLPAAAAPRRTPRRPPPPEAYGPPPPPTPFEMCERATVTGRTKIIPEMLLPAIARVESGRTDPATNRVRPWPWTINVDGVGSFFDSKESAIAAVEALQAKGHKSIDVGCMQVNLYYHPAAFASLDAAFDPQSNVAYAASFLTALHAQSRDWNLATAAYHSQVQERGEDYQRRVFGRVMTPMGPPSAFTIPGQKWPPAGTIYGAIPPASTMFGAFRPQSELFGAFAPPSAGLPVFGAPLLVPNGTDAPAPAHPHRPGRQ